MEMWKDVIGFEEIYKVSNLGNVKRMPWILKTPTGQETLKKERILKPYFNKKGYLVVDMKFGKKRKIGPIHRLVCLAFLDNPINKPQVNHKDGNKINNKLENLEWCTNSENQIHAYKNGLQKCHENHPKSKLTLQQAREIRQRCIIGEKNKGNSILALSKEYEVSHRAIKQILDGITYKEYVL